MNATYHSADTRRAASKHQQFPPLEQENRPRVTTAQAAYYLTFTSQTMREQHMRGTYDPRLNPIKLGNKILWSVAGIKAVLCVEDV